MTELALLGNPTTSGFATQRKTERKTQSRRGWDGISWENKGGMERRKLRGERGGRERRTSDRLHWRKHAKEIHKKDKRKWKEMEEKREKKDTLIEGWRDSEEEMER